jgi:hypothetical protein
MKHLKRFDKTNESISGSNSITIIIPDSISAHMDELGIREENKKDLFENYINHLLGTNYGVELEGFSVWCEQDDNVSDFM